MLSKKYCYNGSTSAFKAAHLDIMTRRDYAECLLAKFNKEIQSTRFKQSIMVSMQGCFVEFCMENGNLHANFHSHMANKNNQDAALPHAHMQVLLDFLTKGKQISLSESTLWEHTDGCTKQYRCVKALYLLSSLAAEF